MAAHDHRTMSSPHLGLDPLFATSNTGESHYVQHDSPFALSSDYTSQEQWKMDSFPQQGYMGVPTTTEFPPGLDQSPNLLSMDCLSELELLSDPSALPDVKPLLVGSSSSTCSMSPMVNVPSAPHPYLSYDPSLGSEGGQVGFIEQQQVKLRQTQQLQQQKLLELQQTILQTQLLKTKLSLASMTVSSSDVATTCVAQSHSNTVSSPSNPTDELTTTTTNGSIASLQMPPGLKLPLPQQPGSCRPAELMPERKTAHNAIERKYRLSINDRINDLRQIITQGDEEMGKKLQKAAVLRKTIDYIRHLENNNRKLLAENRKLRQKMDTSTHSVAQLEQGTVAMITDMNSEPETPPSTLSDASSPSSQGEPSPLPEGPPILPPESPLYSKTQSTHGESAFSGLLSLLNMGDMSRVAFCVVMMFTVALVPGNVFSSAPSALDYKTTHGAARHLSAVEDPTVLSVSALLFTACLRLFIAWLCVGWLVAQSLPLTVGTSSRRYGTFGKFVQQARSCKQKGKYQMATINYYKALDTVGVSVSSSLVSKMAAVVWQAITFVYIKFLCGSWFVQVARRRAILRSKESVGPLEVAQAMFECHEAAMLHGSSCTLQRWQLALSAVNTAQILGRVPGEYWLLCALECRLSFPTPFSTPAMRCCLWRAKARLSYLPPIYHWMVNSEGQEFLTSVEGSWKEERHTTGKPAGPLGSPLLSATHAYLEKSLSEAFQAMLFPQPSSSSQDPSFISSVKSFRSILELSKSVFVSGEGLSNESGFEDITWWAAVGTITSTWLSGASDDAVDVYRLVESVPTVLAHNSDPLPTALLFAFRAHTLYHKERDASQVLHLVHNASTNLTSSVALPTEECSDDKTTSLLWECGRLLGCDWLLSLRLAIWEQAGREEAVRLTLSRGYQTDVDSLSHLASTRSAILPRLLLHKSCLNIMNGANPMQTQQLLAFIRSAPSVRNRKGQAAIAGSEENVSYEQAMAIVLAYKHLPGTFRPQEGGCLLQEAAAIFKKLGSHSGLRQCHALAAQ